MMTIFFIALSLELSAMSLSFEPGAYDLVVIKIWFFLYARDIILLSYLLSNNDFYQTRFWKLILRGNRPGKVASL